MISQTLFIFEGVFYLPALLAFSLIFHGDIQGVFIR